ncbi:hypothetical protein [Pinibacter soli]|uniref:Uncharacterized protein n=1 Tax=Pinibacter soli TaxID=3044211 RepID=A0ABT6RCW7_9BACT|nr:hypothetical protein [Pinibacter soli]MDI3320409.1 hypothetical protein [Pinibacter soli]
MELDALKDQLKLGLESNRFYQKPDLLQSAMLMKAESVVKKIKQSVVAETALAIVASVAFVYFAFAYPSFSFRMYFGAFSCISISFVFALLALRLKLHKLDSDLSVKQNLLDTQSVIKAYVRHYFRFCMILLPVCLCMAVFVFLFEFNSVTPNQSIFTFYMFSHLWLPLIICYFLFSLGMFFFTKLYLQKLYGEHLQLLENLIQELENE